MRPIGLVVAACLGLLACTSTQDLAVDMRTDYVPGLEFAQVEVSFGSRVSVLHDAADDDYIDGVRVARFEAVDRGSALIRARMFSPSGALIVDQRLRVAVRDATRAVTIVITRSCAGLECPGADPAATQCVGGVCQSPECSSESPEACIETCDVDEDCPAPTATCATATCSSGVCLAVAQDTECPSPQVCSPDLGCVLRPGDVSDGGEDAADAGDDAAMDALEPSDAGDDAVMESDVTDAAMDADAADPRCGTACTVDECNSGVWDCSGGEPRCEAMLALPDGSLCGERVEGPWGACNWSGACDNSATQSRDVTSFTCVEGVCETSMAPESRGCTRVTEGDACGGMVSCGSFSCVFPVGGHEYCAGVGREERRCERLQCRSGECALRAYTEFGGGCTRVIATEGDQCAMGNNCCEDGMCRFGTC